MILMFFVQQRYGIGDMLIFLPYLKAISEKNNVKISLLAKKTSRSSELFKSETFLDEIIDLDSTNDGISGFFNLSKEIKKRKFDKIYIFNGSLRYKLIAIFAGIKSIYQYPLFTSKDIIFQTAKVFTEPLVGKILSTEPNLLFKAASKYIADGKANDCICPLLFYYFVPYGFKRIIITHFCRTCS